MKVFKTLFLSLVLITITVYSGVVVSAYANNRISANYLPTTYGGNVKVWASADRETPSKSGNGGKFKWKASSEITGLKSRYKVEQIRCTATVSVSLRSGASLSIGVGKSNVSVGASATFRNMSQTSYWGNDNGAKVSYLSNTALFSPFRDYRINTATVSVVTKVKIKGDPRYYYTSAIV